MPNNASKYQSLREKYPIFYFHSTHCEWTANSNSLNINFHFSIGNDYHFKPTHSIHFPDNKHTQPLTEEAIHTLAFHWGMVELISYWKAACPPKVIVEEYALSEAQKEWWKKLYFQGLGEFFYTNGIALNEEAFMQIECNSQKHFQAIPTYPFANNNIIVPIGGGKDSIVSLELLKTLPQKTLIPLIINPRRASIKSVENAGLEMQKAIVVKRSIDPQLLTLNKAGFLNGHTPFSAMLAFVSLLSAHILQVPLIALSNEASANEATVHGTNINHQYSKSFEFEEDFRQYYQTYLSKGSHYFSLLRPLSELQITALFSQYIWHHHDFRSCNAGSKTDSWCTHCPKCLFTYLMLTPFLPKPDLHKIFGSSLLEKNELGSTLEALRGIAPVKPFECVGTVEEVNIALTHRLKTYEQDQLLQHIPLAKDDLSKQLSNWNTQHALPQELSVHIKDTICKLAHKAKQTK